MEESANAFQPISGDDHRHFSRRHLGMAFSMATGAQVQMNNVELSTPIASQFLREKRKIERFGYGRFVRAQLTYYGPPCAEIEGSEQGEVQVSYDTIKNPIPEKVQITIDPFADLEDEERAIQEAVAPFIPDLEKIGFRVVGHFRVAIYGKGGRALVKLVFSKRRKAYVVRSDTEESLGELVFDRVEDAAAEMVARALLKSKKSKSVKLLEQYRIDTRTIIDRVERPRLEGSPYLLPQVLVAPRQQLSTVNPIDANLSGVSGLCGRLWRRLKCLCR